MLPRSKASKSLGIEATLWDAANKLRGNLVPPDKRPKATDLLSRPSSSRRGWAA